MRDERPARTPKTDNRKDEPKTVACKWCPVQIQMRGGQWVHVDGGPCRSHEYGSA